MHNSYISNNFRGPSLNTRKFCTGKGYEYEEFPDEIMEAPLYEPFSTRRMTMLSRPDSFMLYGKLGVEFLSTSDLPHPNKKLRLRLIRARPYFYMISDNPNVILGIVHCSPYARRIALTDYYRKKKKGHACLYSCGVPLYGEFRKDFSHSCQTKSIHTKNFFDSAPVRRIAIATNTNSAFTGSYTKVFFWYQQFDLRQIRILRGCEPIVDFDAADNCRFIVTTMKTMNFQDEIP